MNPTKQTSKPNREALVDHASEQGGYFTAEQARAFGFSWALLSHHVRSGRFERVHRGVYRLHEYPTSPREDVVAAWLTVGKDVAVVSHESALDILGLSDVIPNAVHLTVPRTRRHLPAISGVKVHTTARPFEQEDVVVRDGLRVTSAARAIVDTAEAGSPPDQIETAVAQAIDRGLATESQLRRQANGRSRRVADLIDRSLKVVRK